MSIVEKALEKQKARTGAADAAFPAAVPSREPAAVPPPPSVPDDSRRTGSAITVDFDSLRRAGIIPEGDAGRRLDDEVRRIKWPLLGAAFGESRVPNGNLLLVTSAVPGEGKTFFSVNLALSIARERDAGVLLIDGDIVKPHVSRLFGLQGRPGLTDVLSGKVASVADAICATDVGGLKILPAGENGGTSPELLASRRMMEVLDWLRTNYADSIILFDSSPLLATNDSQVLSRLVGQVYVVIRADHTLQSLVLEALGLLHEGPVVACILNQVVRSGLEKYYGYGYSHGQSNTAGSGSR